LDLLKKFKHYCPDIPTKCGLIVGLGEVEAEVIVLLNDLKDYQVDYVTIGQYLQPSKSHAPIHRFVTLQEFKHYQTHGERLAFKNIWSAPLVRSSYFADRQYHGEAVPSPYMSE
jgi:lipoic acid synthetase